MMHQKWHTFILFALLFLQDVTIPSTSGSSNVEGRQAFTRLRSIKFLPIKRCAKKNECVNCCTKQRRELYEFLNDIRIPLLEFGSLKVEAYHNYYDPPVANMHCVTVYQALKHLLYNKGIKDEKEGYDTYEHAKKGGWTDKLLIRVDEEIAEHLRVGNATPLWGDGFMGRIKCSISKRKHNLSPKTVDHLMPAYASYFEQKSTPQINAPTDTHIRKQESTATPPPSPPPPPKPEPTDPPTHTSYPLNVAGVIILGSSACAVFVLGKAPKKRKTPEKDTLEGKTQPPILPPTRPQILPFIPQPLPTNTPKLFIHTY